jgi:hypothetical protein
MKLTLQLLFIVFLTTSWLKVVSQTNILDFETASTSTTFQYFGSSLDGSLTEVIDNPDPSGINTSSKVMSFVKPAGAQVWAGAFSNPDPSTNVDFVLNDRMCIKVWMPRPGNIALKLENSISGGANWIINAETNVTNEWVELCYDSKLPSIEAPFEPASGHVYTRIVIFTYFGQMGGATDDVVYMDEFTTLPIPPSTTVILDFETEETGTSFQYFGSGLDGQLTTIIDNPDPSGINTSAKVLSYIKPGDAQVWAGAFSNPDPETPIDATSGGQLCVKVWAPGPGNLALKLEGSVTGPNWIDILPIETGGQWVELCYNLAAPSVEAPFTPASGHVYTRVVLFFDFGTAGNGVEKNYFFDDMILRVGGASSSNITFRLNTSELGSVSSPVYLIGDFNGWAQTNPMNAIGNGIYELDLSLSNGLYEYRYMVGDNEIEERFTGLEECVVSSSGGEINRRIVVSGNNELDPVCFNSCYNCGQAVRITINLGLGEEEADASGVYVAGGQAFDQPGGRFRMQDEDGDGVFSITFERAIGFTSYYTFTNGACPDYSCKEDISGQECANPSNFNDRLLEPVMNDIIINTCFGLCSDNTFCTTSTKESAFLEGLELFPTIASNTVIVKRGLTNSEDLNLSVINLQGALINRYIMSSFEETKQVDVSLLRNGMYLIVAESASGFRALKFVKH